MVRPVSPNVPVTLGYRQRMASRPTYIHRGIDYGARLGTPVMATVAGVVVYAGRGGGYGPAYGTQVVVRTGDVWHLYAHLSSFSVHAGQVVQTGQVIAKTGATGNVTGPHLHYQECTQPPSAYKSDRRPVFPYTEIRDEPAGTPKPGTVTVFDVCNWNVASPRWFTPWAPRATGIGAEIKGEASVYGFQEVYTETQADTLHAAIGRHFHRVPGRAGLEWFADADKWSVERHQNYSSGVQDRWALVVHSVRKETGQHVAFLVTHAPALRPDLRVKFGAWLGRLIDDIDGPLIVLGDFNTSKDHLSPRKDIRARGFRDMREQAPIVNENAPEFPSKGTSLCDIYSKPAGTDDADIVGGVVDLTAARLSDHRRIEATVRVTA
jgi:hypothetical protein